MSQFNLQRSVSDVKKYVELDMVDRKGRRTDRKLIRV